MVNHPIFERFEYRTPVCGRAFISDSFLGTRRRKRYIDKDLWARITQTTSGTGTLDDEYFEWIDLLEAVEAHDGTFTMFELGAGFGRWSVRGAAAARQRGRPPKIVAVEPERQHYRWLRQHLRDNGLRPRDHILRRAVVNATGRPAELTVGMPSGEPDGPSAWYGQAMYWGPAGTKRRRMTDDGWTVEAVPAVTLAGLLAEVELVDLIDMDLQGAELEVVASALDQLGTQARRLHIGTHSAEIEQGLRDALGSRGWESRADFACGQSYDTEFGVVVFGDGVQSWVNPRLG